MQRGKAVDALHEVLAPVLAHEVVAVGLDVGLEFGCFAREEGAGAGVVVKGDAVAAGLRGYYSVQKWGKYDTKRKSTNRAHFVYIDFDDGSRAWVALSWWDILVVLLGAVLVYSA